MAQQIIIKGTPVVAANEVLVAASNSKIPAVDGSAITAIAGGTITGTIPTARLDIGTTANKLVILGASGLPAVDGSLLTGIVSYTKSASDPALDTNPSGGVGTEWVNHTSGKQYICTDATTDTNVWTCSGGGSGNVVPYIYQGTQYGYEHGGEHPAATNRNSITKYSFTVDGNSVDVGDLTATGEYDAGFHSTTHGYRQQTTHLDKYSFITDGNATVVGTLPVSGQTSANTGLSSQLNGYSAGRNSVICRVSFTSDGNAVDVADMSQGRLQPSNSSDTVNGYIMCGADGPTPYETVDKFVYATEANSTAIGDMTTGGWRTGGSSSTTHGYAYGGNYNASVIVDVIDKFNFSGSFTSTDVGNLLANKMGVTGTSSTTYGYCAGGNPPAGIDVIEKYSFSADGNSTDVGNLDVPKDYAAGTSY